MFYLDKIDWEPLAKSNLPMYHYLLLVWAIAYNGNQSATSFYSDSNEWGLTKFYDNQVTTGCTRVFWQLAYNGYHDVFMPAGGFPRTTLAASSATKCQ